VIYNNLGTGSTVYGVSGWNISAGTGFAPAFPFTPASTANFAELDIPIWHNTGTNLATIALLTDVSGHPGSVLESWNVSGTVEGTCCTLQVLPDSLSLVLNGGTTYWVAEESANSNDFTGHWPMNTTGATSVDFDLLRGSSGVILTSGAFEVLSTASSQTPEPGRSDCSSQARSRLPAHDE